MIVDDEDSMRFVLRKALQKISNILIVGEAIRGDQAVSLMEQLLPDAVFMDVEMPGMDGVEAAKLMLDINPKIMIVFITAHQDYMPQAFSLYAFDYIIKPFKLDRLTETVERMQLLQPKDLLPKENVFHKIEGILLKNREGMSLIQPEDIILVQRENRDYIWADGFL